MKGGGRFYRPGKTRLGIPETGNHMDKAAEAMAHASASCHALYEAWVKWDKEQTPDNEERMNELVARAINAGKLLAELKTGGNG